MSLYIDTEKITQILLASNGGRWTQIVPGSFDLDSYEFQSGEVLAHGGGESNVCATGFIVREDGTDTIICGPLTSLIAVSYHDKPDKPPRKKR